MHAAVRGASTKSEKIRRLDDLGVSRAEIARFLDIRYQHVRNVLLAREAKKVESAQSGQPSSGPRRLKIQAGAEGQIAVPARLLEVLGVDQGEAVFAVVEGEGEVRLMSAATALRRAQEFVRTLVPEGSQLADELIADRRHENDRERERG
jgi:bifunctional DNA-binding transcriptional regulator/antitoxin component of YhaV-PrlF toxin-antitoxin module